MIGGKRGWRSTNTWRRVPAATLITFSALLLAWPSRPAAAAERPVSDCTATAGAIVVVDFGHWGGPLLRSCGSTPTNGYALLNQGGWHTSGTEHDGPGFICRIGYAGFRHGTLYPTPAQQACVNTPPASAYWTYWEAGPGQDSWSYNQVGAMSYRPAAGSISLWVFGGTNIGGTTGSGVPTISPASLRRLGTAGSAGPKTPEISNAPPMTLNPPRSAGSYDPAPVTLAIVAVFAAAGIAGLRRRGRRQQRDAVTTDGRLPRALHPVAWGGWAIGLAAAASRTTDPLLLLLIFAVLGLVVAVRRSEAPWARGYRFYLAMAAVVIGIRVGFSVVFAGGVTTGDHIIFRLPVFPMPSWYSGVRIGGPVSAQAVLSAAADGVRLACLLCCIGAANTLANPKRALRVLPGALYELGVAVTVALSMAPQLVESIGRVRRARRLRAVGGRRIAAMGTIAIPVLHDALDRSLLLAAAMDARGYGRTGSASRASRRLTAACLLAGLACLCLGGYGLFDPTAPSSLGIGGFAAGGSLSVAGLVFGGRRVARSRYRPDPWRWPEWVVAGSGLACAVVLCLNLGYDPAVLNPAFYPLHWPSLPLLPTLAILLTAAAAFAAPPPAPTAAAGEKAIPPPAEPVVAAPVATGMSR